MWHEARKQERLIRGMIVDYRRRAERRRDFYEKIKADPTQFLQIHGRPCKIHLDPAVAAAGDSPAIMMPWQGDASNLIDRFDVRAHLDYIPDIKIPEVPVDDLSQEERHCNYESYRILAQNSFLGLNEDKFLHQLQIDEQFGITVDEKEQQREKNTEKKGTGAAIAYSYSDTSAPSTSAGEVKPAVEEEESDEDSDLELMDVDLSIDVNKVEPQQAHALNLHGPSFGMAGCDFFSFLTGDADDAETERQLMLEEREKAMYSGRKSRRERRAHRDKKQSMRVLSPPSYAAPPTAAELASQAATASPSRSRSASPAPPATIQFITSFGGEEEEEIHREPTRKPLYADKVKQKFGPSMEKSFASAVKEGPQRYKRSASPRRNWESRRRSASPRPYRRTKSRSPLSSSLSSTSRSRSRSLSKTKRSRSRSSRSRSKSSRSRSRSRRRKSRSLSKPKDSKAEPGPLPRYYGRRKAEKDSSSELSVDSDSSDDTNATDKNEVTVAGGKSGSNQNSQRGVANKGKSAGAGEGVSLKERLRKKMQAQLSRQLRADQRAQAERQEREQQLQQERDDEMRELAIRIRRRQREMRHRSASRNSNSSRSERSPSETRSVKSKKDRDRSRGRDRSVSRSRSKSTSPAERAPKIAIWESERDKEIDSKLYDNQTPPSFRKRPDKSIFDKIPRKVPVWETNPDVEMKTRHDSERKQYGPSKVANEEDGYERNRVWESRGNYNDRRQNPGSSSVPHNRAPKYDRRIPVVWESEESYNKNVRHPRTSLLGHQPDGYEKNYREENYDDKRNFRNDERFKSGQSNTWGGSNSRVPREDRDSRQGVRKDEPYDNDFRRKDSSNPKQGKKLVDY